MQGLPKPRLRIVVYVVMGTMMPQPERSAIRLAAYAISEIDAEVPDGSAIGVGFILQPPIGSQRRQTSSAPVPRYLRQNLLQLDTVIRIRLLLEILLEAGHIHQAGLRVKPPG